MDLTTLPGIVKTLVIVGLIGVGGALPAVNDSLTPKEQAVDNGDDAATGACTGSGIPADKVSAAGSKIVAVAPDIQETLLEACVRTSTTSDMAFQVTLECTIFTGLVTNEDTPSSLARGTVVVWVEVDDVIVPINSGAAGTDADKATFCDRTYSRTLEDQEDPSDGLDEEDDYISTKSSHSFNWIGLNLGNGVHHVEVVADLTATTEGDATASAEVGNRVLVAEPTHMWQAETV